MNFKDLKDFVNSIKENEFDEMDIVFRSLTETNENETYTVCDNPIAAIQIDKNTNEICFFRYKFNTLFNNVNQCY
jgi:hypothetical protein